MIAKLQHWSLRSRTLGEWQSPEQNGVCLFGLVAGHARHQDGKEVMTTPVMRCQANCVVTRSGSAYELGLADPAYELCYPGALQRLRARLQQDGSPEVASASAPRSDGGVSILGKLLKWLGFRRPNT